MLRKRNRSAGLRPVILIVALCLAISLFSSTTGSYMLTSAAESLAAGGSDCSSFLDGFAVGMGIASLFGCVWCPAAAIGAKAVGLFC